MSISIKLPFNETQEGGVFLSNKTTQESVRTNLISLLTTKKRHRVMNNSLYSPIWDYIYEPWDDISASKLKSDLIMKISEFINSVEVVDIIFEFTEEDNLLEIKTIYRILDLGGVLDSVSVVVPIELGQ